MTRKPLSGDQSLELPPAAVLACLEKFLRNVTVLVEQRWRNTESVSIEGILQSPSGWTAKGKGRNTIPWRERP